MRKLLTALSFAALTIAVTGMAGAQGDFRTSSVRIAATQVAQARAHAPIQQAGTGDRTRNDILINHPEPKGNSGGF